MTREEIIDGLEIYTVGRSNKDRVHITVEELQDFIDAIKALSPVTSWIPVSERLPEIGIDVLICDTEGTIYLSHRSSSDHYYDEWGNKIKDVIAWMPLPEQYKASPAGAESEG